MADKVVRASQHTSTVGRRALLIGPIAVVGIALVLAPGSTAQKVLVSAAIVVLAGALILVGDLVQSLPFSSLEIAGVKIEFPDLVATPGEDEEGNGSPALSKDRDDLATTWRKTRWAIEAKLTYLAKHTLPDHVYIVKPDSEGSGADRPFLTIGSLRHDRLLDETDAEIATTLLALSPTDLAVMDPTNLASLLNEASRLSRVLRLRVFQNLVESFWNERNYELVNEHSLTSTYRNSDGQRVAVRVAFSTVRGRLAQRSAQVLGNAEPLAVVVVPKWPGRESQSVQSDNGAWIVPLDLLDQFLATHRQSAD